MDQSREHNAGCAGGERWLGRQQPKPIWVVVRQHMEARMTLIWLGALLVLAGVAFIAVQPLWGRLSGGRRRAGRPIETLEPQSPTRGFGIGSNWPGLALIAIGAALLLAAATTF
jgi:hypothetical protein